MKARSASTIRLKSICRNFMAKWSRAKDEPSHSELASSLQPATHPILVREILSHTSGLPFQVIGPARRS